MTGGDPGIWDDGEWISWDEINSVLYRQELAEEYPNADPVVVEIFDDMVASALNYFDHTGRHLDIFGELGELFAEIRYGIRRHKMNAQGSDGKLGDDFVEIKTISPMKKDGLVFVKRSGHFSRLVVVRINDFYEFESKIVDRKALPKGLGKTAKVRWDSIESNDLE